MKTFQDQEMCLPQHCQCRRDQTLKTSHNHFRGELVIDDSLRLIMECRFPFRPSASIKSEGVAVHCEVVYVPEMPAHPIQMFDSSRGPMPSSYHQWLLSGCSRRRVMASIAASTAPQDSSENSARRAFTSDIESLDFTKGAAEVSVLESLPD